MASLRERWLNADGEGGGHEWPPCVPERVGDFAPVRVRVRMGGKMGLALGDDSEPGIQVTLSGLRPS
jgi:hypothetical protein